MEGEGAVFPFLVDGLTNATSGIGYELAGTNYAHLNTGILAFNQYAITFVLDDGTGKAFVGIEPLTGLRHEIFVKKRQTTSQRTLRVRGTASAGVTSVLYRAKGDRKWRKASSVANWSFRAKHLEIGKNVFQVRALGSGGQSAPHRVIIRRDRK